MITLALDSVVAESDRDPLWLYRNFSQDGDEVHIPSTGLDGAVRIAEQRGEWFVALGAHGRSGRWRDGERFSLSRYDTTVDLGLRTKEFGELLHPSVSARVGVAAFAMHVTGDGTQLMAAPHFAVGAAIACGRGEVRPRLELRGEALVQDEEWNGASVVGGTLYEWGFNGGGRSLHASIGLEFR